MSLGKPVIKSTAMDAEMAEFAYMQAKEALEKSVSEKVRAKTLIDVRMLHH